MALHYDLTAIPEENRTIVADRDGNTAMGERFKKGDRLVSPITNALIWSTMSVGMNEITEDNARRFYDRLRLQQKLFGPELRRPDGSGVEISFDDVKANIGLRTNATNHKDAAWLKMTFDSHANEVSRELAVAAREAETKRRMGA